MQVNFTGLQFDSSELSERRLSTWRYPQTWDRVRCAPLDPKKLANFVEANLNGRYTFFSHFDMERDVIFVVMFEDTNDALMFKLLDGEKECSLY